MNIATTTEAADQIREECCILNEGAGSWAFEPLAKQLSVALGIAISDRPRRFNYLLNLENVGLTAGQASFISQEAIKLASDKRLLAEVFKKAEVPTPETHLVETMDEARSVVRSNPGKDWCLKYPTGCGGSGHRMIDETVVEPRNWPKPFVVQEFVRMKRAEVYRTYCAGGELFGWMVRQFPEDTAVSPWVAHARGARYADRGEAPATAKEAATKALSATGLLPSFGCVDLMPGRDGQWLVLEVGTDGLVNHVDRELDNPELERQMNLRIAAAFWKAAKDTTDGNRTSQ